MMDDKEFNGLVDVVLVWIEVVLEVSDVDIDFELVVGGVLEIEFVDGSKIIVNCYGVVWEIWVVV